MNTIEGLKALPNIINKLIDERDAIQDKLHKCYQPFRELIQDEFIASKSGCLCVDDIDIGVNDTIVSFTLKDRYDGECEGTYKFPIEAFVSTETFIQHLCVLRIQKAKELIAKEENRKRITEEVERATYEKLKKKFEGA